MTDLSKPLDPTSEWARDHVHRYVATDGANGHEWKPGVFTLLLTTAGRRTGQARRTPLIYGRDGGNYLVVASKGGHPTPPDWYTNLRADPHVRVQVGEEVFDATARDADPAEQARLWPAMAEIWPDYDNYQKRTDRQIPIVVLTPVR